MFCNWRFVANSASVLFGALSALFWVLSAFAKAPPPEGLEGKPDGAYWGGIIVNGAELIGTMRKQSKWNSCAAVCAALAVSLQVISQTIPE